MTKFVNVFMFLQLSQRFRRMFIWRENTAFLSDLHNDYIRAVTVTGSDLSGWGLGGLNPRRIFGPFQSTSIWAPGGGVDSNPSSSYCYWLSLACTYSNGNIIVFYV